MKSIFLAIVFSLLIISTGFSAFEPSVKAESVAPVFLENLYKEADFVGFVKILSGDAEHYEAAMYKAEVQIAYKGAKNKEIIYFSRREGYQIGNEYLAFFKKSDKTIGQNIVKDIKNSSAPYDAEKGLFYIMYGGYSIMHADYECAFEDNDYRDQCDWSVRLNANQILLPKTLKAYPDNPRDFREKYVRRKEIEVALEDLKRKNP